MPVIRNLGLLLYLDMRELLYCIFDFSSFDSSSFVSSLTRGLTCTFLATAYQPDHRVLPTLIGENTSRSDRRLYQGEGILSR